MTAEIMTKTKDHRKMVRRKKPKMRKRNRMYQRKRSAHVFTSKTIQTGFYVILPDPWWNDDKLVKCRLILLFSADGGSRCRRAPSSIQLHLLVLQTYPRETSQYTELWTEYKADWQLCLGKLFFSWHTVEKRLSRKWKRNHVGLFSNIWYYNIPSKR